MLIEDGNPADWRELQNRVAQILGECGFTTEVGVTMQTARGTVEVDVYAVDSDQTPASTLICECKLWRRRASKATVHAFRAQFGDVDQLFRRKLTSRFAQN